jgi:hypothetical protein
MYSAAAIKPHLREAITKRTKRLPAAPGKVSYAYIRMLIRKVRDIK